MHTKTFKMKTEKIKIKVKIMQKWTATLKL